MKTFNLAQVSTAASPAIESEPALVAQGVLFDDGTVALCLTLPRLKAYYSRGARPGRALPILTFSTFEVTPLDAPLTGFRNEFTDKNFSVVWLT